MAIDYIWKTGTCLLDGRPKCCVNYSYKFQLIISFNNNKIHDKIPRFLSENTSNILVETVEKAFILTG